MGHDLFVQMLIILDAADTFTHCLPSFSFFRYPAPIRLDPLSPSRKVREGLADVIMHEMLTDQILLFHSETVATPCLQYVRLLLEGERGSRKVREGLA